MRALITGGAGFIGSHLAERLARTGSSRCRCSTTCRPAASRTSSTWPGHPRFSVHDRLGDGRSRCSARWSSGADVVFHLAAAVGVRLVVEQPVHTIETNVHGTETVLRHASRGTASWCWSLSTSEVYGKSDDLPFREDADLVMGPPNKTRWGYATSKLLDEFLALGYWKEEQLPVIVVRLFNTVGPRQSSRYGMVLPNFVRRALARRADHRARRRHARRAASPGSATSSRR